MIWYWMLLAVGSLLNIMFSFLPRVTELPWGVETWLVNGVHMFNAFKDIFPPLGVLFTAFLAYLSFRVTLLTLRLLRIIR